MVKVNVTLCRDFFDKSPGEQDKAVIEAVREAVIEFENDLCPERLRILGEKMATFYDTWLFARMNNDLMGFTDDQIH